MRKVSTSSYHPNGNGGIERLNHTTAQMLAMVVSSMPVVVRCPRPTDGRTATGGIAVVTGARPPSCCSTNYGCCCSPPGSGTRLLNAPHFHVATVVCRPRPTCCRATAWPIAATGSDRPTRQASGPHPLQGRGGCMPLAARRRKSHRSAHRGCYSTTSRPLDLRAHCPPVGCANWLGTPTR